MKSRIRNHGFALGRRALIVFASAVLVLAFPTPAVLPGFDSAAFAGPRIAKVKNKNTSAPSAEEEAELKRKWRTLPREKKEEYRRRMKKFKSLPSRDRELYRRRYQQLRKLPPQERQRLKRQLDRWERLSPEERDEIRKKFINRLIFPPPQGRIRKSG